MAKNHSETITELQSVLGVELPVDFINISYFGCGYLLGGIDNYPICREGNPLNIVDETLRLRRVVGLPDRFVVIAEPPASLIVMDTSLKPAVIWIDAVEISKLDTNTFITKPVVWDNYADYFKELLDTEEDDADS